MSQGPPKACVSTCPATTYPNSEQQLCAPCHASCGNCFGPGAANCESCSNSSHYLFSGR